MVTIGLFRYWFLTLIWVIAGLLADATAFSQDSGNEWWEQVNNWDGVTPWESYIILSPAYLGPGALPVPESGKGLVPDELLIEIRPGFSWMKGDNTWDVFLRSRIPVVKKIVSLDFYGVPFEHYNMSESLVMERRGRNRDGKGSSVGDFYFGTVVQLMRDRKFPDLTLGMFCRTASATGLADARCTDTPGYHFDLTTGRSFSLKREGSYFRPALMLGFLVWQLNQGQDDAFLFGAGADLVVGKFFSSASFDGYIGYFGDEKYSPLPAVPEVPFRDKPMVVRFNAGCKFPLFDLSLGYQRGVHDFNYQTLRFSLIYHGGK